MRSSSSASLAMRVVQSPRDGQQPTWFELCGQDGLFRKADAVIDGCDLRFRPLLMTALASFIGHLPMLYATGAGADIQITYFAIELAKWL